MRQAVRHDHQIYPVFQPCFRQAPVSGRTVLIDSDTVDNRIAVMGQELSRQVGIEQRPVVLIEVQKGGVDFARLLKMHIQTPEFRFETVRTSRYRRGEQAGKLHLLHDVDKEIIEGSVVWLLDDIADARETLFFLREQMIQKGALDVHSWTLLNKPSRQQANIKVVSGFNIPDVWIFGRGLDGGEKDEYTRNDTDICYKGPAKVDVSVPFTLPDLVPQ